MFGERQSNIDLICDVLNITHGWVDRMEFCRYLARHMELEGEVCIAGWRRGASRIGRTPQGVCEGQAWNPEQWRQVREREEKVLLCR